MTDPLPVQARLARWLGIRADESTPALLGMLMFFFLFTGYFMLRPVRETMGIAGGVQNLQWLFTGTLVATIAAMPLFGWAAARVPRRHILNWTLGFFLCNLLLFALLMAIRPDDIWTARAFYIWLSVFSLLAVSVLWSVLADLFRMRQARRLFSLMAAGASAGGLCGPILGALLVGTLGHAGLLLLCAALLVATIATGTRLQRWRDHNPLADAADDTRRDTLGGSPFAGAAAVLTSPLLLGICVFVLLLASVTTFLYFEQARLIEQAFPDRLDQTRVFSIIDAIVQALAILTQLFLTGRIAQRLGVGALLMAVPLLTAVGFGALLLAPTFAVLAVVMVVRRAGEYALIRPGREMLFTIVPTEQKYKAKNVIDTVVYRAADAASGWLKVVIDGMAQHPAAASCVGGALTLLWAYTGWRLARRATAAVTAAEPAPARGATGSPRS